MNFFQRLLKPVVTFCLVVGLATCAPDSLWAATQTTTYSTPGTFTFTVPAGVYLLDLEVWGAGGGGRPSGATNGSGGGGGGAYGKKNNYAVVPNQAVAIVVRAGGASGLAGGSTGGAGANTTIDSTVLVGRPGASSTAGTPGSAGGATDASGDVKFAGAAGGAGGTVAGSRSGAGGGSAAGTSAAGNAGTAGTTPTGGAGGVAVTDGGAGGAGADNGTAVAGTAGSSPGGGGGGGAGAGAALGGRGGDGQVRITWQSPQPSYPRNRYGGGGAPRRAGNMNRPPARSSFSLSALRVDAITAGMNTDTSVFLDAVYQNATGSTVDHNAQVTPVGLAAGTPILYSSSNASVATVDTAGAVTRVADGTVTITGQTPATSRTVAVSVSRETTATSTFSVFSNGTASKTAADAVDALISGKTASVAKPIFSTRDDVTPSYVRNTGTVNIDMTAWSVWNSRRANLMGYCLIAKDIAIGVNHYSTQPQAGDTYRFVKADNTLVTLTVTGTSQVGSRDMRLIRFTADAPSGITPCKVLPKTWASNFPNLAFASYSAYQAASAANHLVRMPILYSDQEKKVLVTDMLGDPADYRSLFTTNPLDATRLSFTELPVFGDSGSPICMVVGGALVCLGSISGETVIDNYDAINSTMTSLGSAYQLTDCAP